MSTTRTHCITLLKKEIRENDRIYVMYSKELGKVEAVARGSRKILSKLAPHLEPPFFSDLMIAKGKNLDKIAGAEGLEAYPKIKSDVVRIQLVFSCLDKLNRLTKFNWPDQKIWALLEKFLKICEDTENAVFSEKNEVLGCAFLVKLLAFLGYRPELKKCVFCGTSRVILSEAEGSLRQSLRDFSTCPDKSGLGRNDKEEIFFDFSKGGIICSDCATKFPSANGTAKAVSGKFLEEMNFLLYNKFDEILEDKSFKTLSAETGEIISLLAENYKV